MRGVVYRLLDGAITKIVTATTVDDIALQVHTGEQYLLSSLGDVADYYVNLVVEPTITPKEDYTLEALPVPCTVTIEGVEYLVTEQPAFTFNYPGTYTIKVDAGPQFLLKEFEYDYQP